MTATSPIERVVLTHLQIPLKEPFRISGGEVAIKDAILVTVETSSGIGHGESSPMAAGFGYSADTPEGCWDDLDDTDRPQPDRPAVDSPEDIAALAVGLDGSRFAVAGAETALWDLLGQAHHATIAELLGAIDEQISLGVQSGLAVGLYPTIVELLKAIETHLAEGYRRVKIKIQPGSDVELVRAVRQHFGDIPLMVDANGAYTAADLDVFRQLDDFDLLMFEQPMAAGRPRRPGRAAEGASRRRSASTRRPRRSSRPPRRSAAGPAGSSTSRSSASGGSGRPGRSTTSASEHGVACWVGTMPELGIGQAAGIHLAALANCKYPTDIEPSARWFVDDYVVPPLELSVPGPVQRPDPARPRLPGRPGQGPALPGPPGRVHGQDDRVGSATADRPRTVDPPVRSLDDRLASRREFLAAATAGLARRRPERIGRSGRSPPIIDTHDHLWDLTKLPAPLAGAGDPPAPQLPLGRLPRGDAGAERRQGDLHGSGRRPVAARAEAGTWPRSAGAATRPWPPR